MSERPIVAAKKPVSVDLKKGETYYWCRCGRSQDQPFCDGSHKGTGITPLEFTAESDGEAWLCQCKGTSDKPFCDGTHNKLNVDVGDELPEDVGQKDDEAPKAEPTPEEPTVARIHAMAREGLKGHHGEMGAMGVPRKDLPHWDDIQILTAQLATKPLQDSAVVGTKLIIGPRAKK